MTLNYVIFHDDIVFFKVFHYLKTSVLVFCRCIHSAFYELRKIVKKYVLKQ